MANPKEEQNRTSRESTSRTSDERQKTWMPPTMLPTPEEPGYRFRWIRTSVVGLSDTRNVSMRLREGWEPCKAEDYPDYRALADDKSEWGKRGCIEVGGLILCKSADEIMQQREEYYRDLANQQLEAVDNNFMRENNPRMPLIPTERKTTVSFGKG